MISSLSSPNAPLDVIEGYAWGREWLWGTYKHPPMQAWILEFCAILTGRASWAHFLASQIAVVIAFWAVWQTGRRIAGETQALIGVVLLEGVIYYNFTSTEFNPNVLQLPFWALSGWSFHRAVKENHIVDWLLLGFWGACGLYTKYSSALLLSVFVVLLITRPEARRCLKKSGPYLAIFVCVALFSPHLAWLWRHNFLPFTYVIERLEAIGPATRYVTPPALFPTFLLSPAVFIVGQILALLPAALLFFTLDDVSTPPQQNKKINKFDRHFLATITFAPMVVTLLLAMCFGYKIHDMWGAPFFNFIGLWAVLRFYPRGAEMCPRFMISWGIVFVAGLLGIWSVNCLSPYFKNKLLRINFPGSELARKISTAWHQRYHGTLHYVVGDTWPAGNVAYYAPDRPHLFINADYTISPWINHDELTQQGAVIVWCQHHCSKHVEDRNPANESEPAFLHEQFPQAEIQPSIELSRQTDADLPKVMIGWAIVPPRP